MGWLETHRCCKQLKKCLFKFSQSFSGCRAKTLMQDCFSREAAIYKYIFLAEQNVWHTVCMICIPQVSCFGVCVTYTVAWLSYADFDIALKVSSSHSWHSEVVR